MAHHLLRFQNLIDQHQTVNNLTNHVVLRYVNNPSVDRTCCCQTQKIIILSKNDAAFFSRLSQMFFVRQSQGARFWNSQDIHTSSTQPHHNSF